MLESSTLSLIPRFFASVFKIDAREQHGQRGGLQIPGFDVGNTPQEFSPEVVGGKTVVMTTTNGTRALRACSSASRSGGRCANPAPLL